ncbi:DUF5610 domain-containing protein [Colwellia psychrerythraea]|uniref:DUF5610 domain-containing protein n=1 Tax=Colwellia psychrerythraea TaxID=28229 RepID=A0A099KLB5_COLPS|nr:DUF5610 domain-containing protein [Colwellia psychrerythraea]KGJ91554.1 hypothetical protein ND2E_3419 [Colwellia psychrerythraea]
MNSAIKSNATFSQDVRSLAKVQDKKENGPIGQNISALAHEKKVGEVQQSIAVSNKKQLNAAIIESTLKFSNTVGDQPLSLLLRTALQGINEALKEDGVESNVEDAYESGIDFSPEATAERIVSFSTQFLGAYQAQHPEMDAEESLTSFMDIIGGGIEQGFSEAKDILGNLKVLEGDIANNIVNTHELVKVGLQSFVDSFNQAEE